MGVIKTLWTLSGRLCSVFSGTTDMATITSRKTTKGRSYRVQVRFRGYPAATKTFARRDDAKRWAAKVETEIIEGKYFGKAEASRHTLGEMLDRFVERELPRRRKGNAKLTHQLLWWKEQAGGRTLDRVDRVLWIASRKGLCVYTKDEC